MIQLSNNKVFPLKGKEILAPNNRAKKLALYESTWSYLPAGIWRAFSQA